MKVQMTELEKWIGQCMTAVDRITPVPVLAMAATLDREEADAGDGDVLPPLWHWLYFLPLHRHSEIGQDGHPRRGGFLPPVPLPRRMWAGSRLQFVQPLRIGESVERVSRIESVSGKHGRSGELVFVKVHHTLSNAAGPAILEEHDIVYREEPAPDATPPVSRPAPDCAAWEVELYPDEVLLFRYSALTFNGHRIHYDWPYVTGVEGYPGLVVHGPLIATLLLEHMQRQLPGVQLAAYEFRAVSPAFNTVPFFVCGQPAADGRSVKLWARSAEGALHMEATATLA